MALHLVLSRLISVSSPPRPRLTLSRISYCSEWSTIDLQPQFPRKIEQKGRVVCSGDGLLCIYGTSIYRLCVIWNPSTDEYQSINDGLDSTNAPCACSYRGGCEREVVNFAHGLGLVPESHDYKLVRFMTCKYDSEYFSDQDDDDDDDRVTHPCSHHVAVYSSKTRSWKEVPFPFHFEDISPKRGEISTCVNGFVYWLTMMDVILSFDLSTDKFSTLPCPDDIPRDFSWKGDNHDAHLLELDGSLCLVIELEKKATTKLLSFWVYSASSSSSSSPWTRKINLDVRLDADIPLWLGKKNNGGELLMLQGFDGSVLEYDYTTRELKRIDIIDIISPYPTQAGKFNKMIISPYVATIANKRGNGDIVDRISQLPDDMILRILSFLSPKEAASTSVLSTRWSDLWKHTPNLNFHYANVIRMDQYIEWVNSVVESHKAVSLQEFSITFPNYEYTYKSTSSIVIKWLKFALPRRVEVLELNCFARSFDFLRTVLKSTNLISLCLNSLKVSGSDIGLLLRNCPLLERLTIKSAALTSDLEVCGSALKHMDIQYCEGGKSIRGYAPNLTSLKIDSYPFSLEDEDDDVDYVDPHIHLAWAARQSADEPPLLPFISSQLTTLEFTLHSPPKGFFGNRFPQVPTLRELIVTYLGGHGIRPITSLIRAFPYLEEFEIKCFKRIQKHTRSPIGGPGMDVVNNVERFCHRFLRVFKFTWFDVDDGDHMKLMSYILDNCVGLQKIILDIYGADPPSYVAAGEYAKQLQSKLPTHIQLIVSFNNRQLV